MHKILPSSWIGERRLITARSYFIDRAVPECEIILLPEKKVSGGTLTANMVDSSYSKKSKNFRKYFVLKTDEPVKTDGRIIFDFRVRTPENWSHFLNIHLPIFFVISAELEISWDDAVIVLPAKTPAYILNATRLFGVDVIITDGDVIGKKIDFMISRWAAVRADWHEWVNFERVRQLVNVAVKGAAPTPNKIFLTRKSTRAISNQREVELFLSNLGFTTVYPEELSVGEQFKIFHDAEVIVGVHGAGIAPLLYSGLEKERARCFVEILPCGHMSDAFRTMCEKVGWRWIGGRGKIKSEYVTAAYDFRKELFSEFSLDSFEVDVRSLGIAMSISKVN